MLALKMEESMWRGRLLGAESSPPQKGNKEGVLVLHPRGTWVLPQPKQAWNRILPLSLQKGMQPYRPPDSSVGP